MVLVQLYSEISLTCRVPDGVLDSAVGDDGRRRHPLAGPGRAVALKWEKKFFLSLKKGPILR